MAPLVDVTAFAGMAVAGVPSRLSTCWSVRLEEDWGRGFEERVPALRMLGLPPSLKGSFAVCPLDADIVLFTA